MRQLDKTTKSLLLEQVMNRKGFNKTESEIYIQRFENVRKQFGYARAYAMFIQNLL